MGSLKCFHAVNVHILVVNSQYDVVSFTVCNYQFLRETMSFCIYRVAREIMQTHLVIYRADMHAWALRNIFVLYTGTY